MSNVTSSSNSLKPIISSDKIAPSIKIAENVAHQATNATQKVLEKSKTFVEDITEHLPAWVKDTPAKIGEKTTEIIRYATENPKTSLAVGGLMALTTGIAIGRVSKGNYSDDNDKNLSFEEKLIKEFLHSK